MIKVKKLQYYVKNKMILQDISIDFEKGKIYGIIGPNGSGKSTLLKHLMNIIEVSKNTIFYNNKDIKTFRVKDYAKEVSFVFQENVREVDFSVYEILRMGRYTRMDLWGNLDKEDEKAIKGIMEELHITHLKDRKIHSLSGGEAQKVFIGRALLQETPVLLLDEPTSMLDVYNGIELIECIKGLKKKYELTIIMVLHDLNLAFHSCDQLILLNKGKMVAKGSPQELLLSEELQDVYHHKVKIIKEEHKSYIVPKLVEESNLY